MGDADPDARSRGPASGGSSADPHAVEALYVAAWELMVARCRTDLNFNREALLTELCRTQSTDPMTLRGLNRTISQQATLQDLEVAARKGSAAMGVAQGSVVAQSQASQREPPPHSVARYQRPNVPPRGGRTPFPHIAAPGRELAAAPVDIRRPAGHAAWAGEGGHREHMTNAPFRQQAAAMGMLGGMVPGGSLSGMRRQDDGGVHEMLPTVRDEREAWYPVYLQYSPRAVQSTPSVSASASGELGKTTRASNSPSWMA